MPQLPVGNLQQSRTTQSGNVRADPNAAAQPFRDIQGIGGGLLSLGEQLNKVQNVWQKAKVTNQYTTARNTRKGEINAILADAEAEPDHTNDQFYRDKLDDIVKQDHEIDDEDVKFIFNSDGELDQDMAGTRLDKLFRGKMIDHQLGEILKAGDMAEEAYVNERDVDGSAVSGQAMRANIKGEYLNSLEISKDGGFLTRAQYEGAVEDTKEWEYNRAIKMAYENPQYVLDNMGEFALEKGQPDQVIKMAKSSMFRQAAIADIAISQKHTDNQAEFSLMVYGDPTIPIAEKLVMVNRAAGLGDLSEGFARDARIYLNSAGRIKSKTNLAEFSKITGLMYDVNATFDSVVIDEKKYLRSVQQIQGLIMGSSRLSNEDRSALQKELNTITKKKIATATGMLTSGRDNQMYKDALEVFKKDVPEALRSHAVRKFFFRTTGVEGLKPKDLEIIAHSVSAQVVNSRRESSQNAFDRAIESQGSLADLREVTLKDGTTGIGLFKNNKFVKGITIVADDD